MLVILIFMSFWKEKLLLLPFEEIYINKVGQKKDPLYHHLGETEKQDLIRVLLSIWYNTTVEAERESKGRCSIIYKSTIWFINQSIRSSADGNNINIYRENLNA